MQYPVGSLVNARDREWVVQAQSTDSLLILKPLGGNEDEVTGVLPALENVVQASFSMPDAEHLGDYASCRLLRDAMKLGMRSTSGPFRSFGHINVDPRPYQFVPLIMAMRLDPVHMLIADDVGVGKTIEACLIAKELIDRGEVSSMAVLCPPHLAEQWQRELKEKFHIDTVLVLSGSASKLERDIGFSRSLFDEYPFTVVSLDYIKTDKRRSEFKRSCPDLIIVDEAHTCTEDMQGRGTGQQRFELLYEISGMEDRHIIMLTATPHSGKEGNFRSLLTLLNRSFANMPQDLSGNENRGQRELLAKHFVQRRRADVVNFMSELGSSPFPEREYSEQTYQLTRGYLALLNQARDWAKSVVIGTNNGNQVFDRVQWWSALALLQAISSSPAAAEATLLKRSVAGDFDTIEDVNEYGNAVLLDGEADEFTGVVDMTPGANNYDDREDRRRHSLLREMARQAKALRGDNDPKLLAVLPLVEQLLKDGYNPILFCRYIDTAEYLAEELNRRVNVKYKAEIWAVTGRLAPEEREDRISELGSKPRRVLVATDCLSEGINLQANFDAIIHYDLTWNPTRHEQREGRIDRYGQPKPKVRTITYFGSNNAIDGVVLRVLLRKHQNIRKALGVSVPVPSDGNQLAEAMLEGYLLTEMTPEGEQLVFEEVLQYAQPLEAQWQRAADQERRSRAIFAQHSVQATEVVTLWEQAQQAIGADRVAEFLHLACRMHSVPVAQAGDGLEIDFGAATAVQTGIRQAADLDKQVRLKFSLPVKGKEIFVNRTHPMVEGLANYLFLDALDQHPTTNARRSGVMRTAAVKERTIMLLVRARYNITETKRSRPVKETLAEDCYVVAFTGSTTPVWLEEERIEALLNAAPSSNVTQEDRTHFFDRAKEIALRMGPELAQLAQARADAILEQHLRVRSGTVSTTNAFISLIPSGELLPVDILGLYVLIP